MSLVWRAYIGRALVLSLALFATKRVLADVMAWEQLSVSEQDTLQAYKTQWGGLSERQQSALKRWADLSPKQRSNMKQRFQEWQALSAKERQKVISQLQRFQSMSTEQRKRVRAWRQWVKQLPTDEQQHLYQQWPAMDDQQRKDYIQSLQRRYGR